MNASRIVADAITTVTGTAYSAPLSRALDLAEDLHVDSLALAELIEILEERLGVTIPDEETGRVNTVGELFDIISRHSTSR